MNNNQNDQNRINLNEYVPDPSKRNELKRRLYDSGISNVPMPSVKREIEENISTKPYQAKMNTNKIQSVSKVKNDIVNVTHDIYSKLQDSYKEAARIEAQYKGEGTAEYYKNQHVNVPPSQVLQGTLRASQRLVPQLATDEDGQPQITGMAATNKILLNKCGKPNQLPSLSDYGRQRMAEAGQTLDPNMRFLQGPPTTMMTGFEGGHSMNQKNLELARSKFLLDKLTNKLPASLRQGMGQKLPPVASDSARDSVAGKTESNKVPAPQVYNDGSIGHADEKQSKEVVTQKWSDLDKFIELLLDSKSEEETVFVYLNPNNETGDPYQLEILNNFNDRNKNRYYTLSGKGLTLYIKDTPQEFISLGQWLIERDSYNCIKEFKFFKQFKKWKFMRMWKKTIKREARVKATNQLETKLFILQNIFSDHLMKHRKLMLEMANRKFIDECEGSGEVKTLEDFAQAQVNKTEQVSEDIKRFSQKSRDNIKECITNVLIELRSRILSEITLDEQRRQQQPAGNSNQGAAIKRKETKDSSDTLGFPEGMTFGHRSRLRAACSRFLRFAFLVDFLALESLANIYLYSVDAMIKRLERLDTSCDIKLICEGDQSDSNITTAPRGLEPLFYVEVKLDERPISKSDEDSRQIEEFILPPRGTSEIQDFDPIAHLVIEEEKEVEEEPGEEDEKPPEPIIQRTVPKIDQLWLTMSPSKEDYVNVIQRTFQSGLDKIKNFERWSKHSQLMPYRNVLEDWDDIVGEPGWDMLDSVNLDPKNWIADNALYLQRKPLVNSILNRSYDKLEMFLQRFQPILELYWRNKQADLQLLVNEDLRNPQDSLINIIELFNYQKEYFNARLPPQADIGLVQLDSKKARQAIQPTPQKYLEELQNFIPKVIRDRNDVAKKWLKENLVKLDFEPEDLEAFVTQQEAYNYVSENFQDFRDKIGLYGEFYNILEDKGLKIPKGDKESQNESLTEINKVQNTIQKIESNQEKDKERFKKDMNVRIPALDKEINDVFDKAKDKKYLDGENMEKMFDIINELDAIENHFKQLEATAEKYNNQQVVLEMMPTVFENLDEARTEITLRAQMWRSLRQWEEMNEDWVGTKFSDIDPTAIAKEADKYFSIAMRLEKNLDPNPIQETLKKKVVTFKEAMPIVKALGNERLEAKHLEEIKVLVQKDFNVKDDEFTLKKLLELDINQFQEQIVGISNAATQEYKLRKELEELDMRWKEINFNIAVDASGDPQKLTEMDEIFTNLDESLAQINMILGSRFVKPLREEAENWKKNIQILSDMVDEWLKCQRQTLYLRPIFAAKDIQKILNEEAKQFTRVDTKFKTLMKKVDKAKNCLKFVKQFPVTLEELKKNNTILDDCNKKLEDYMNQKRTEFPRFFFLSNDELIDILANSQDIDRIQLHMKVLFDNLVNVRVEDEDKLAAMISSEKEETQLKKKVTATGGPEKWLRELQDRMIETLSTKMREGVTGYPACEVNSVAERIKFIKNRQHPGQVIATVAQIKWCEETENAFSDLQGGNILALEDLIKQNEQQISDMIVEVRGNLGSLDRKIIVALITTDVHARDIIVELHKDKVGSDKDFKWSKQLRYYYDDQAAESQNVNIKQVSATLYYGYEYMGATSRLVITPLTDKCWITISNALHINLGANPAGPAGTGKTESTKDLAKALAIQCIVYNCSDQVDYIMMGKLFSGLCQQGCWTCLDEFNRILIEVLSVIAQQLQTITDGLKAKAETIRLEDAEILLKPEFGCHVTMNPGYAGRTELPDNLQVLFRPVAMMIPYYALISEIMLMAEGFDGARILSQKMVQLYQLSSQQLSQQKHYDFGLRAVKSVLNMAGSMKRAAPDSPGDEVLIRAMREANIPKFLRDDVLLFNAIVQDLFPTATISEVENTELKPIIIEIIQQNNYVATDNFVLKVLQLYETFNVRFGVMNIGFTGAGKTVCYEILQKVMSYMREIKDHPNEAYQSVKKIVFNPKAIDMGELYGFVDLETQEWYDGLASKEMRNASMETGEEKTWVVFDGPVDALWIENMNTVLDDNMTLCLSNGQRIKLRTQMRMLFEVNDLEVASPATVSRCGMVYFTQEALGWRPFVRRWLSTFFEDKDESVITEAVKSQLDMLFEATLDEGLDYLRTHLPPEPIQTTDLQLVTSMVNLLEYFLDESKGFKGNDDEKKKITEQIFAWSFTWGLGASLTTAGKDRFDAKIRDLFKAAQIPPTNTCFDFFYDMKPKEKLFKPWATKVATFEYDKEASFFDLMVPTADTTRHSFVLEVLLTGQKACFFTGESGVGKSAVIQNLIDRLKKDYLQPININMSAKTDSKRVQSSIQDKLEKKKRTVLGALPGKKIAIFVDDINMPAPEEWGASPPIELLRLFLDKQGLFTRGDWEWRDVEDTTMIACSAPPGGGRNDLTPRFTRRFNMITLPQPTEGILNEIFGQILGNFLNTGFAEKVKNQKEAAINSTIEIYNRIQTDMRPTPDRFHYQFNLRDVSKVIQGLCMTKPVSVQTDDVFMRLWVNEATRVFADRLINDGDREIYKNIIQELLSKNFKMSPDIGELFEKLKFSDLLKLDSPTQLYEYITDKAKLLKVLHGSLDEFNLSNANKMHLVLFDDALEHLIKIARVLKQPRGHIMLIGVGGSGKQSLIRLCSFMRKIEMRQIEINKGYNINNFLDFMKIQMKEAAINEQGIAFVMTDTQIIDEAFIENLNNLLNVGEIPNLMADEDKDEIKNGVRPICQKRKITDDLDNIFNLFTTLVRENLHICLCMSPVGSVLRVRCRNFPSLVNCCTLDWFARWPEQALLFVSQEFLKDLPDCTEEVKNNLAEMCMKIHTSVEEMSDEFWDSLRRRVYTTPKSYLDLISLYTKLLEVKREEMEKNKNRLAIGLKKLIDTNQNIAELKVKIEEMVPKLKVKNEELSVVIEKVTADKAVADEKEAKVSGEAEIVNKQAAEAKIIADDAQSDLDKAAPIMKEAQAAVNDIDRNAIVDIQKMSAPSENIKFMMGGCMVLLGEKSTDWKQGVQKALSNVNEFMKKLQTLDPEKVKEKTWKKVNDTYLKDERFDPEKAKSISGAVANICKWAHALYKYSVIVKDVAPKKAKYAEVSSVLKKAESELKVKTDEVAKVKAQVAELEANMQKMLDEKEQLEFEMDRSTKRMSRANKLVGLLADEGVRWKNTVEVIQDQIDKLVGDVFISCACISYYGAFTGEYRKRLIDTWLGGCLEREIPTSEDYSLVNTMGDPVVIRSWGIASLPSDPTSTENGILTTKAERFPLCIDPQQQANKWIKNMEKDNNPLTLKFGHPTFLRDVTMAVNNGRPLLVEDVEEHVDPAMDPILLKQQYAADGGMFQIRLGDKTVDYDEHFSFAMTSKMPNPHYIPEICIKVTLINFTVTQAGLEQQLLGDVVKAEKPEVEKQRDEVVLTMAKDSKTLKDLENTILELLSKATIEEILDEDTLIEILEDSKTKSTEINLRMEQSKVVEVQINETRMQYINVAIRGSVLYFVISDLGGIDNMYQNSLQYVKQLFNRAIAEAPKSDDLDERINILIDKITRILYTNISRGLFERDKLIYSMLIATSIQKQANEIDLGIWNAFLRGPTVMSAEESAAKPERPEQVKELLWDTLYSGEIRSTGKIDGVTQHIADNWDEWDAWANSEEPYDTPTPGDYNETMSSFTKLLLVRALRSELAQQSVSLYVIRQMTEFYITPPLSNMNILYEDLANFIPMIFILSKGADPTTSLLNFARSKGVTNEKLLSISLGQGQGVKASRFIDQAMEDGSWVVLQNCHLAESWMPELEQKVLSFGDRKDTMSEDFRLFMTSMPASYFPVAVLQNSLKLTTEPPRGLKANMTRCYDNYTQPYLEECAAKDKLTVWRKLLFNFAFFHACIQERRKFGPLGWNIRYEFNDSDLETSNIMLKGFLENQDEIPWDAINWITGMINYGGRVTDPQDTHALATILDKYCSNASLANDYKYSQSGIYYAPADTDIEGYRSYIKTLPLTDTPEIFGLHSNANITYQNTESLRLIDTVLSIQPRLATTGGGLTPDEIVLNKAKEFTEALPPLLTKEESDPKLWVLNSQGVIPSLSTVLVEEMVRFNILLNKMRSSLEELDLAINGFSVMTEELDLMYVAIQNNKVPDNWTAVSYLCLKPLSSWFKDMQLRVEFIDNWVKNGNPSSYWMSGMFFPHGFLTGCKQAHARKHMIAIDQIEYSFEILEYELPDEEFDRPEDGVYIYGLFSDGGRWDRDSGLLEEQVPGRLFDTMPIVHFKPIDRLAEVAVDKDDEIQIYQAPLYKAANREGKLSTTGQSTNYVIHVSIPSNKSPSHWTQRAAALLCMLSD